MNRHNIFFRALLRNALAAGLSMICASLALASVAVSAPSIVLIDASRHAKPALVYSTNEAKLAASSKFHFLRLSPPVSPKFECCAIIVGAQTKSRDLVVFGEANETGGKYAKARLSKRGTPQFIGIGMTGASPLVSHENDRTFSLKWPNGGATLRVNHCVSSETFHVRVVDATTSKEQLRYSLPLGMDVEANCDDSVMPKR